jgi:hypothetical protein
MFDMALDELALAVAETAFNSKTDAVRKLFQSFVPAMMEYLANLLPVC